MFNKFQIPDVVKNRQNYLIKRSNDTLQRSIMTNEFSNEKKKKKKEKQCS